MSSKLDIPLHGTSVNIVRQCGPPLSDVLESKFGCVATIDGVDFERDPSGARQRSPAVVQEKRFSATLHGGVQMSVWKADLVHFSADAIVNAANERLQHGGGLALALSNAGGPQIQEESDEYLSKYGSVRTGDVVVLDAGNLPCKKIIHAVGPCLSRYPTSSVLREAEGLLEMAIKSILYNVEKHCLQSVAIPAISSGLFNYPLQDCANTIVRTVKRYYETAYPPKHLPKEIFLVNIDEPTVREMERACRLMFGGGKIKAEAKTSTLTVQLGNVHLTLRRGKIEEQQTDVIVNTTSSHRDLQFGRVSKALLQTAGRKMQEEIFAARQTGPIIVTNPYKLQCKQVYHICYPDKLEVRAQQTLFKSVSECLWMAASNNHKSIAFPAIGTGVLCFDKKEVAQIMSDAVADFAQKFPEQMDVFFVIFPQDNDTFKAFEGKIGHLQQNASHPSFAQAFEPTDVFRGGSAPTPRIRLSGPSDEATREAERWLSGLLRKSFGPVTVRNNFVQHFGEQEHLQLSLLMKKGVSIEEFFEKGHAGVTVSGDSVVDVVVAGLQVEAMLCKVQREFAAEEEGTVLQATLNVNVPFERTTVNNASPEFMERSAAFHEHGLRIVKVDRVENPALKMLFDLKKAQLHCSTSQNMFQRIPAQFCGMVSRIGFHSECAPPDEPAYGEGIYFASEVKKAMEVWKVQREQTEEYLYFVEAEVLTGKSTAGKPGLILPPAVGTDPRVLYDSVSGGPDVSVIFSGYQALPKYVVTCKTA